MAPGLATFALEEVSQRGLKNPLGRAGLARHRLVDLHALAFDLEQQFVTGGHGDLLRHVRNSGLRQRRYGKEDRANSRQENTKTPRHGKSPHMGVIGQLPPNDTAHLPAGLDKRSEINHGIHRNTRKRESESTSPFLVVPGGGPTPAGWGAPPVGWGRSVVTR